MRLYRVTQHPHPLNHNPTFLLTNLKPFASFRLAPHYRPPVIAGLLALACLIASAVSIFTSPATEELLATANDTLPAPDPASQPPENPIDFQQISQWHLLGEANAPTINSADAAPETQLQLQLLGILKFSDNPAGTHAIIGAADQTQKTYRVKETLPGGAILERIEANKALLRVDSRYESLSLRKFNADPQPTGENPSLPSQ